MSERVRQSIAISGINTAEPCHTVVDGAMEDIFNLRYKNGAFVGVCEPKLIAPVSNTNGYKIIYSMECIRGKYIARYGNSIHFVKIDNGSIASLQQIAKLPAGYSDLRLSHFGFVLYINYYLNGDLNEICSIYKDGQFAAFDMGSILPPEFTIELASIELANGNDTLTPVMDVETKSNGEIVKTALYNAHLEKLHDLGFFVGFTFISVAYSMFDGSIVKCGQIHGISSYGRRQQLGGNGLARQKVDDNIERYFAVIVGSKATIKISIPDSIKSSGMIKSVVVIASRCNPLYEYDKIKEKFGIHGSLGEPSGYERCGNNCILNQVAIDPKQPLYKVAEVGLDNTEPIELTYLDHFKDIESLPVYEASFSNNTTISGGRFEYNNRMHAYNVKFTPDTNFKIKPFNEELPHPSAIYEWKDDVYVAMKIHTSIDNQARILVKHFKVHTLAVGGKRYVMVNNLITYPDARATKCELFIDVKNIVGVTTLVKREFALKPSLENNFSYAFIDLRPNIDNVHYYALIDINVDSPNGEKLPPEESISVTQTNKLHVSAMNNPFYTPAINIYTIGDSSSVIDSICTATEQITETKFGAFPLYVFTDRAIHALEVGNGEIVYQRVIGISNDIKLPGTTTTGAANLVFFISARGVMAVEGRHITCISEPLNHYVGLKPLRDLFTDYCKDARILYNPIENELVVYSPSHSYAYLYSLVGRYWSRRSWTSIEIGYQSEIYVQNRGVASAWIEDASIHMANCLFESRAVKLRSLEFKRLETLIARMSHGGMSDYELKLFGSNDLQSWDALSTTHLQPVIRRTSASYKFFKIRLECNVNDYFAITNFDVEHYLRFVRKLR